MRALSAADGTAFATLLDSRGVTWALVKPDSNAIRHFDALPGWRRAYGDDTAVVYTRLNPPDKNVTTKIDQPEIEDCVRQLAGDAARGGRTGRLCGSSSAFHFSDTRDKADKIAAVCQRVKSWIAH